MGWRGEAQRGRPRLTKREKRKRARLLIMYVRVEGEEIDNASLLDAHREAMDLYDCQQSQVTAERAMRYTHRTHAHTITS